MSLLNGLGGLVLLILDIYCIYLVIAGRGDPAMKLLWIILILILPIVGPLLYLLLGRSRLV